MNPAYPALQADVSSNKSGSAVLGGKTFSIRYPNGVEDNDKPIGIAFHWSATEPSILYNDYTFCISKHSNPVAVFKTQKINIKDQATWKRNSGLINISFMCTTEGADIPSKDELEVAAILAAELCAWFSIDPTGTYQKQKYKYIRNTDSLVADVGMMTFNTVTDHAEYAQKDGYYPDRVDIGTYMKPLRARTQEIYKELKANKRQFQFHKLFKD